MGIDGEALYINENMERLTKGLRSESVQDISLGSHPIFVESGSGTYQGWTIPVDTDGKGSPMHRERYPAEDSLYQKLDMYKLTKREKELTVLVLQGYSNRNIAESIYYDSLGFLDGKF